jgi:hypothetical protein
MPVQHKRAEDLAKHGGAEGLSASLRTSLRTGLAHTDTDARGLERRRAEFGANKFKEVKPRPFLRLLLDNLRDPTLILLMVAAAVRTSGPPYKAPAALALGTWGGAAAGCGLALQAGGERPSVRCGGREPSVRRCTQQPHVAPPGGHNSQSRQYGQ